MKVGYWNISDARATTSPTGRCTAHVFDIHEREQIMTIAYYNGGVRVVDLSGLAGGEGMKQIGFYKTENADSWSAKTPAIERNGSFYLFGNDIARGLDIWKFEGAGKQSGKRGRWMSGSEAQAQFAERRLPIPSGYSLLCLTPR